MLDWRESGNWSILMGNRLLKWALFAFIIIGAGLIFYKKVYLPKSTYRYVVAKRGDLNLTVFGIGVVSAKNIYPISSNGGGRILQFFKDEGEFIKKGELIAILDPVDLPKQLEELKALLKRVKLESKAAKEELYQLKAKFQLIKKTFNRYNALYKKSYVSKAEYDKALSDLNVIKAQIEGAKVKIEANSAEEKRVQKSIEALKEKISRLSINSPVDGYIIQKNAEVGETIMPQQPLITVVKPKEVWVKAYIDERISGDIKKGQEALITLRSKSNKKLTGFVARIEAKSDPVTQERVVDVAFKKTPFPFYIDEQAEVRIKTQSLRGVIVIPLNVIKRQGVWIYRNGEAHFKKLTILGKNDKFAAVEGIKENEKILILDSHKKPLFEGADIRL